VDRRVSLVTLGVRGLARARSFYEQLVLALGGRDQLAEHSGVEDGSVYIETPG